MTLRLSDVTGLLDGWYPPSTAESWDAVGLVCGDPDQPVAKVLFAVDPAPAVVEEAEAWGADLVVVHHPLLLTAVAPVLIASFAFNFNNFNLIFLLTNGGPPIAGSIAGETDIMISFTNRVAFGGAVARYGLATAVSTLIFIVVAMISMIGFRFTKSFEEVR